MRNTLARGGSDSILDRLASARLTVVALIGTWLIGNLLWLAHFRSERVFDHEEVGYVAFAYRAGRASSLDELKRAFAAYIYGPMQAGLTAPFQWVFGADPMAAVWLNVALGAGIAFLVYVSTADLAGRPAGTFACAFILLSPGLVENSRSALNVIPATFFLLLTVVALVLGRGLLSTRWSIVAGAAIGAMTISRTMTIAFIPGLAVAAIAWTILGRTSFRQVARNGVLAVASGAVVAGWWWVIKGEYVWDYLTNTSSDGATPFSYWILSSRVGEVLWHLGLAVPLLGAAGFAMLRTWKNSPPTYDSEAPHAPHVLPLWPLWSVAVVGLIISLASATYGWFMLPLTPVVIVAAAAGSARLLPERHWRTWASAMLGGAAITIAYLAVFTPMPGNRYTWCPHPSVSGESTCRVTSQDDLREWRSAIDDVASTTHELSEAMVEPSIAIAARDVLLLPSSISLSALVQYDWELDGYAFFRSDETPQVQLSRVIADANIVLVAPDPETILLDASRPSPEVIRETLVDSGFSVCTAVGTPMGPVQILVRTTASDRCP